MKAFTNLEQSKKLAEILPIESADSHYVRQTHDFRGNTVDSKWSHPKYGNPNSRYANYIVQNFSSYETIPCWSLTALLDVLESEIDGEEGETYQLNIEKDGTWWNVWYRERYDEADPIEAASTEEFVDACVEMIEKLHKQKLL